MPEALTTAAVLLVAGPLIGTACLFYPPFWQVWMVPRDEHLAMVAGHRVAWIMVNVGFSVATVLTAAGLAVLAAALDVSEASRAVLAGGAILYAIAGTLWCTVQAIRARTTPALAALVAAAMPTEPAEGILGSALSGLFEAFMLMTCGALVAIGITLALGGGVAAPVAWLTTLIPVAVLVGMIGGRDMLPAFVYPPTLILGIALLLGWA